MKVRRTVLLAALMALVASPAALAQPGQLGQPDQPDRRDRDRDFPEADQRAGQRQAERGGQQQAITQIVATRLALCNQVEIQLAQIAAREANNEQVKQFAQQVVQDHQQLQQQLARFTGGPVSLQADAQPGQTRPGQTRQDRPRATEQRVTGGPGSAGDSQLQQQVIQLIQQTAQNKLEMCQQMLREQQGQDFDMAFLSQQIGAHASLIAELKAIQAVGIQPLQEFAQNAERQVQQHLDTAKQLAQQIERDTTRTTP